MMSWIAPVIGDLRPLWLRVIVWSTALAIAAWTIAKLPHG
jgi:hypothetical protein